MQTRRPTVSPPNLFLVPPRPKAVPDVDAVDDWLSDVTVLPEQFYRPPDNAHKACGEIALMQAVLAEAISCFQRGVVTEGRRAQRLAKEAEQWLFADDPLWLFSFVNICAVLGLEPEYIRLGLKRWRQRPPVAQKKRRRAMPAPQPLRLSA